MSTVLDVHAFWMIAIFICGYFFLTIEHVIRIDKATIALLMGVLCWLIQFIHDPTHSCVHSVNCLGEHLASISQIIFFLMGALAIVELINVHNGFSIIAKMINIQSKRQLLWVVGLITFFMSAILDNLTTTIVMITLLRGIIKDREDRWLIGACVVIAANAGGAWTPIGDVTTTMLWIGGQVSTWPIMRDLFLPSLVSMLVVFFVFSFVLKGDFENTNITPDKDLEPKGVLVFILGLLALVAVPVLKMLTGLPPFMGILLGLSVMWLVTDIVHRDYKDRHHLRVPNVLSNIDMSSLLFFLGILLAIDAMDAAKVLDALARWFDHYVGNVNIIATMIGLASAVIDNVPLVAAAMGMYSLEQFPIDHQFWQLVAFCAGTGGSILIIGSAAGVVFMGLEKVNFLWYLKRISLPALIGYFAGIGTYLLLTI